MSCVSRIVPCSSVASVSSEKVVAGPSKDIQASLFRVYAYRYDFLLRKRYLSIFPVPLLPVQLLPAPLLPPVLKCYQGNY